MMLLPGIDCFSSKVSFIAWVLSGSYTYCPPSNANHKDDGASVAKKITSLCTAASTLAIAASLSLLIALALIRKKLNKSMYILQLEMMGGSNFEYAAVWSCLILTCITCVVFSFGSKGTGDTGFEVQADLYHSSWISFFISIRLLYLFTKEYKDVDFVNAIKAGGTRCLAWHILFFSSVISLASSVDFFIQAKCSSSNNSNIPRTDFYSIDGNAYCRRTALAIGFSASSTFVSIMILCEIRSVKEYSKNLLLDGESLFSVLLLLTSAITLFFDTGVNGSAGGINELYYSLWISFIGYVHLSSSCIIEQVARRKESEGRNASSTQ